MAAKKNQTEKVKEVTPKLPEETNEQSYKVTEPRNRKKTEEKTKTSTGKVFVGGYINPLCDILNSEQSNKTGKTRSKNLETLVALGLIVGGYGKKIIKAMPELEYNLDFAKLKEKGFLD